MRSIQARSRIVLLLAALLLLALARVETGAADLRGRPLAGSLLAPVTIGAAPLPAYPIILVSGRERLFNGELLRQRALEAWDIAGELWRSWGGRLPPD